MNTPLPTQAQQAYSTALIEEAQARLDDVRAWPPSPRREALIEEYACVICEEMERAELMAELDLEGAEASAALDAAIDTAQAVGCALVTGAPTLVRELLERAPGCMERRGHLEIACVQLEDGELRLVRRRGSYQAALAWRAA